MNIFENYKFKEGELEKTILDYLQKEQLFGELGHQRENVINLRNISHEITKLTFDEFEYKILETPSGKILKEIEKEVKFKPRMIGEVNENGEFFNVEIISIDACYE